MKQSSVKTGLNLLVLFLGLLTFIAVGVGWNTLQQSSAELSGLAQNAAVQGINERFQQTFYIFVALLILAGSLVIATMLTVSRSISRPLREAVQYFDRLALGDLTGRIDVRSHGEVAALFSSLKRMQDSLGRAVGSVRLGVQHINAGVLQIADGHADLSSQTQHQAATLQQTSASMEQLASTVKQNADNARQANQLATTASQVAQRGGDAVGEVVATMQGISASSKKISDIVGVIDSIAFQTNILALNAAVEAARAGEQGKGFAVVASEVRALAQRSAHAAKEIKDLITDSVKKVSEGSDQVERAGATMQEIVTSVARVTDIMGEISAATTEQSSGIDQINLAVGQMDGATRHNAVLVEQASASAVELRNHVSYVSNAVGAFKVLGNQVIDVAVSTTTASHALPTSRPVKSVSTKRPEALTGQPAPKKAPAASRLAAPESRNDDEWEEF